MDLVKGKDPELAGWLVRFADVDTELGLFIASILIVSIGFILFIFTRRRWLFKTIFITGLVLFTGLALIYVARFYIDTQAKTLIYQSHQTVAKVSPEKTIKVRTIPATIGGVEKVRVRDIKLTHHKSTFTQPAKDIKGIKKGDRVTVKYQVKPQPYKRPNRVDYLNQDGTIKYHIDLKDMKQKDAIEIER